jgi:hypothetical protein
VTAPPVKKIFRKSVDKRSGVWYNKIVERDKSPKGKEGAKMRYGMTYDEMIALVDEMGWEVLGEEECEEDGETWVDVDLMVDSESGMSVTLVDGVVAEFGRFAMWDYYDAQ